MTLISANDTSGLCPIKWAEEVVQLAAEKSPLIADSFDPMATTSDTRVTYLSIPPETKTTPEGNGPGFNGDPTYLEKQLTPLSVRGQVLVSSEFASDIGPAKRTQMSRLMASSAVRTTAELMWTEAASLPTAVTASGPTMDSISASDLADMTAAVSQDAVMNAKFYIPSLSWGKIANQFSGGLLGAPKSSNAVANILGFDVCLHPIAPPTAGGVGILFGDASKGFAFGTPSDANPVVRMLDQPRAATDQVLVSVFWRIVLGALDNSGGMTSLKLAS